MTWEDPLATLSAASGLPGLEFMRAVFEGRLPPPPIMATIGIFGGEVEEGKAVFFGEAGEYLYNRSAWCTEDSP